MTNDHIRDMTNQQWQKAVAAGPKAGLWKPATRTSSTSPTSGPWPPAASTPTSGQSPTRTSQHCPDNAT